MKHDNFKLKSIDQTEFHCYQWHDGNPRAIVQIVHGVSEHAMRYAPFAEALVGRGFAVLAEDHRGHGQTATTVGNMGPANALERVCDDVVCLTKHASTLFPGIPVILFGHSMGSLISQLLIPQHGDLYTAVILSGSPSIDGLAGARPVIDEAVTQAGRDASAEELQMAMFGAFLEDIPNPRTPFDWLSHDTAEVDKYIEDPLCGFALTLGSFHDLSHAASGTANVETLKKIPADLPMLILSGSDDPAHAKGTAIDQLLAGYREAGLTRVSTRLYQGGRHEMLNELNRQEVIGDIIGWIENTLVESG